MAIHNWGGVGTLPDIKKDPDGFASAVGVYLDGLIRQVNRLSPFDPTSIPDYKALAIDWDSWSDVDLTTLAAAYATQGTGFDFTCKNTGKLIIFLSCEVLINNGGVLIKPGLSGVGVLGDERIKVQIPVAADYTFSPCMIAVADVSVAGAGHLGIDMAVIGAPTGTVSQIRMGVIYP